MEFLTFQLWLDEQISTKMLVEASEKSFETEKDGKVCLKGYQGFSQHSPYIRAFAQANPENFAQVVLFGPLTANTQFSRFNDWYPVLIDFLRRRDTVKPEQVANFISGIGGQRLAKGVPDINGGLFASVLYGKKIDLISHVWNNRDSLYKRAMKLAEKGAYGQLLKEFSMLPAVQPVKAGFMIQLMFGELGCIDLHNMNIYRSMSDQMARNPDISPEEQAKWKELRHMLDAGYPWNANKKKGEGEVEKVVNAYSQVLDHMKNELGVNPRVLWDVWVNHVAQRYEKDKNNQYSREQGLAYNPSDPELYKTFGKDFKVQRYNASGKPISSLDLIAPHASSGAVSRVHLIAAISPDELLDQIPANLDNKYHLINASLRGDPTSMPALQALSDRLRDRYAMQSILLSGGKINKAWDAKKAQNERIYDQMIENAKKALFFIFTRRYNLQSREAVDLVEIYTKILNKLYKNNLDKIIATLRAAQTRQDKLSGKYVGDDEKVGHGMDTFDTKSPFNPKNPTNKLDRLQSFIDPYIEPMRNLRAKLSALRISGDTLREKIKTVKSSISKIKAQMEKVAPAEREELEDRLFSLNSVLDSLTSLSNKAKSQINAEKDINREKLHPDLVRKQPTDIDI